MDPLVVTFEAAGELEDTFSEEGELSSKEPYIDRPAVIFKTGFWKGKNWTHADLDRAVAMFKEPTGETGWKVPLQIDHEPHSATRTCGWPTKLWRDGDLLRAHLRVTGKENVSSVKGGRLKLISPGFRANGAVHHIAFTPYPYIDGPQIFHEEEQPMAVTPPIPAPQPPATPPAAAEGAAVTTFAEFEARMQKQFEDKTSALTAQFSQRLTTMQEQLEGQRKIIRFQELAGVVDTFSEQAKIAPVARGAELELVKTFSDEQLELWKKAKESAPSYVEFGVFGTQSQTAPGKADEDDSDRLREKYPQPKGGE